MKYLVFEIISLILNFYLKTKHIYYINRPTSVISSNFTTTMDYNTESVITEIVKRPRGRPKICTEEEQKEKVKTESRKYYE